MLPGQKEKLEKLINTTPLLSSKERIEWWSLLDLMNDQQVEIFEKLLTSPKPTISQTPAIDPKQPSVSVTPPIVKPVAPPLQPAPKLSHILNMPRVENAVHTGEAPKPPVQKPAFEQKIKEILSEKELPAPKKQDESPAQTINKLKVELEKNSLKPENVIPKFEPPIKASATPPPTAPPIQPKPPQPVVQPKVVEESPKNGFSKSFVEKLRLGKSASPLGKPRGSARPLKLETLQDVSGLIEADVQDNDLNALLSRLKNLIEKFGYYPVVFNLEKSPVYKTYIQTGVHLLDSNGDFEKSEGLERHLTKADFEKIADLLSKIQLD